MADNKPRTIPLPIEEEVRTSYLNYAMSVIVSRALPDVRDGLKPVHRRILYGMNEMGLRSDRPYKKCARITGDVLGKYHPHGDMAIYDSLVRLAQDFNMRYPVVDGQGNFGSIDGDPPAAVRYTEARMNRIAEEMLRDIDKDTVDFGPNYDGTQQEPLVLPGAFPFLLANGSSGIAVGMATNIPPQNLREVCAAVVKLIETPDVSPEDIMKIVRGPDFPTGGIILGRKGIRDAYLTGRGRIIVRARVTVESSSQGRDSIIVTEIPYQVNKSALIVRIADLVKEKKIDGIVDLNDESDRHGMRIVIDLRKGVSPKVILNQLFAHTQLQTAFGVISLALVRGLPKTLSLREMLKHFIDHRKEVVTRRSRYDLARAEERAHILEGLKVALENIDEVIAIIKKSENAEAARLNLIGRFTFSEKQAQAILDMRLQRLTSLEVQKVIDELSEVLALIEQLRDLLSSEAKILAVVKEETRDISERFGDERRTEIVEEEAEEINVEDLIAEEDMAILISNRGYIKRIPVTAYRRQGRGGKGSSSAQLKEDDFIEQFFVASTHDYVLFITNQGKAYWVKVHEIPESSRQAKGQSIKVLLSLGSEEEITAVVSLRNFEDERFVLMATRQGVVKKVAISEFTNAKTRGIVAIKLDERDHLVTALLTTGESEVVFVTRKGNALRFGEEAVRAMGRASHGVQGIRLSDKDELAGVAMVAEGEQMLLVSEFGFGKRTSYDNFSPHGRGTRGQICYRVTEKTGEVIGVLSVNDRDDLVCITSQGNTLKLRLAEVAALGKTAMGVRIVNITKPDVVVGVARVVKDDQQTEGPASEETNGEKGFAVNGGPGNAEEVTGSEEEPTAEASESEEGEDLE
ncbi:MAG TPA: DNA topoisomerase (ATP-hydrolyzing) subunit A [Spirochaetia bacterium]|nr:DNA topoisomerase (ATP-hydrolyzing) subunit A [Spirochaetia bacterium]